MNEKTESESSTCSELRNIDIDQILHRGTELLMDEPMLLEIDLGPQGAIVGDIHGRMADLMNIFVDAGLPSKTKFLFLGDYVDRGPQQLETLLFILLLKMRWPGHVYMLRGNHETVEMNKQYQFADVCERTYGQHVYEHFATLFDVMPVAAIVNDETLCCHGGVSQWLTSRDAVRNIPRPAYFSNMEVHQNLLLNDLLWADPCASQKSEYAPSKRNTSYTFNEAALDEALRAIKCTRLVRAHEQVENGVHEEFHGKCVTVHTIPKHHHSRNYYSYLLTTMINGCIELEKRRRPPNLHNQIRLFCDVLKHRIKRHAIDCNKNGKSETEVAGNCELCRNRIPKRLMEEHRLISHQQIIQMLSRHPAEVQQLVGTGPDEEHLIEQFRRIYADLMSSGNDHKENSDAHRVPGFRNRFLYNLKSIKERLCRLRELARCCKRPRRRRYKGEEKGEPTDSQLGRAY